MSEVKQINLTDEQMQAAIYRATENSKTWAVWKDPVRAKCTCLWSCTATSATIHNADPNCPIHGQGAKP